MRGLWALALDASVEATAFSHDFSASLRTLQLAERGAPDIKTRCGGIPAARPVKLVMIAEQWRSPTPPRTQFFMVVEVFGSSGRSALGSVTVAPQRTGSI